jgi:hypothetical protein
VHRKSVVGPEAAEAYFTRLAARVRAAPDARRYLVDVSRSSVRKLTPRELAVVADTRHVTAGFVVPERSVSTRWVADAFLDALSAEPRIDFVPQTVVRTVESTDGRVRSPLRIRTADGRTDGPFDSVVNALWEGRLAIDGSLGLRPKGSWSHRYRRCLFVRTRTPVDAPSAVVCAGPFGDVKSYSPRDFYVSWYPAGLLAAGGDLVPPPTPRLDAAAKAALAQATFDGLGEILDCVHDIRWRPKRWTSRAGGSLPGAEARSATLDPPCTSGTVSAFTDGVRTCRSTPASTRLRPGWPGNSPTRLPARRRRSAAV